jgi:hypothetical protein
MPFTIFKFGALLDDLRTSWYFRIYAFLWFVCAVVAFAGLIIFGSKSTSETNNKLWKTYVTFPESINFPSFRIRIESDENQRLSSVTCRHSGVLLTTSDCGEVYGNKTWWDRTKCQKINADKIRVPKKLVKYSDAWIQCEINTTIAINDANSLLAWELTGKAKPEGANAYASMWFQPNENAWILLRKDVSVDIKGKETQLWDRALVYHSTVAKAGHYKLTTIISDFRVNHYKEEIAYDGWMAMGDFGGFIIFLVVLHTITMLVFGIFLEYDGRFLPCPPAYGGNSNL